jgi:hypothetical protein
MISGLGRDAAAVGRAECDPLRWKKLIRVGGPPVAQVEIVEEREQAGGWVFEAQVIDDAGELRRHRIDLAWVDYNHWSASGSDEPAAIAAAVLRFLLTRQDAAEIRGRFDASLVRRLFEDADEHIPGLIHPR